MMDHLLGAPPLGAPLPSLLESIPTVIPVICGSLLGELRTRDLTIALSTSSSSLAHGNGPYHHHHHHGRRVSPTEFERLAGKESSKKWKATIRVLGTNGVPGETIGAWLAASGIDAETATGTGGGGTAGGGGLFEMETAAAADDADISEEPRPRLVVVVHHVEPGADRCR
jgi:hypothetical protein